VLWEVGPFTNIRLLAVVLGSAVIQIGIHHIPATRELFQLGELSAQDCVLSLLLGLVPVTVIEVVKLLRRFGGKHLRLTPQEAR